jgi:internalin A
VVLRWEGCRAMVKADKQERQVLVRVIGSTGDPPVPSGDSPDGTGRASFTNRRSVAIAAASTIPIGGSPTGAGESPALPIQKRRRLLAVIRENFDQIHAEMKEFKPVEWVAVEGRPDAWLDYGELEVFEQQKEMELRKRVGSEVVPINVTKVLDGTDVPGARRRDESRAAAARPLKLFISYAHEDEKWRAKLAPNLDLLQREGLVEVWCDLQIRPGDKWDDAIKRELDEAELYLFLMSTELLASVYVQEIELPIARQRDKENKARLVPVVLSACSWKRYVGDVQGLPTGGQALKQWRDKDEACFDVEEGLRKTIADMYALRGRS